MHPAKPLTLPSADPLQQDYLWLEDVLIERVKSVLPELKLVGPAASLIRAKDGAQVSPAAYVIYLGDEVGGTRGNPSPTRGEMQFVTQLWAVALMVAYGDRKGDGAGARNLAGPLASRILTSVSGWQPQGCQFPLKRRNGARPEYEGNFMVLPLVFETGFFMASQAGNRRPGGHRHVP